MKIDDLISRQAAIEAIEKYFDGLPIQGHYDMVRIIKNLPSAQPEQRWIPVTERLPEIENNIGKRVIVTTSWGLVREAYYCFNHWEMNDIDYKLSSVTAWMPLPEPWKGGADD